MRGLTQASANAQDGISAVQTAEGALNEVHDMLQRINELAVKGENGTLTSADRSYIQSEVRQLMSEIDRVQSTTTFNEQNLLDGSFTNKGLMVGAEAGQHIGVTITNMNTNQLIGQAIKDGTKFAVHHPELSTDGTNVKARDMRMDTAMTKDGSNSITLTAGMLDAFYSFDVNKMVENNNVKKADVTAVSASTTNLTGAGTAPTAADFAALNAFAKSALKTVAQQRSDLGAVQNRLEHTINNLDNIVENTTSAESEIRDTDMATEMVRFANNNILAQAGQSMLAQANQSNQGVLSLLG